MSVSADLIPSPSSSPSLSPTRARRLSTRRGSVSASDPWGAHAGINNNPSRATSSRLTIVRVPQNEEDDQRTHRRHSSNMSIGSTSSSGKGEGSRMSFAFTSFSPPSHNATPHAGSPTSSPRIRPQSPNLARRYSGSMSSSAKLSPDQLLDVARQSCNPHPCVSNGTSPVPHTPASFTLLPDSIFLPFLDRPAEVSQMISSPPTAKLFALLAQTFPAEARAPSGSESVETLMSRDPKQWTYTELEFWMKTVDRDVADDTLWVYKARTCIMAKSELIWERIKGALGVPPELDVDEEELLSMLQPQPDLEPEPESALSLSDSDRYPSVFEHSSPLLALNSPSPTSDHDEISIEPVIVGNTVRLPTSSSIESSASHELHDVREEDETEEAEGDNSGANGNLEEPDVHGLRITTSPAMLSGPRYAVSPGGSPSSLPLGIPSVSPIAIPSAVECHDKDTPYDALQERGPGHPLFPSSFAQLSMAPTLRNNNRAYRSQSLWNLPPPVFGSPNAIRLGMPRAVSTTGGGGAAHGRPFRPEWAHAYDLARYEFAVSSSAGSVSARD